MATPSLAALERAVEDDPTSLDVRALCVYLASDDTEERNQAQDVRTAAVESGVDPTPIVDDLVALLDDGDDDVRRAAVGTLNRFVRVRPRSLVPVVARELDADDPRRRGGAASVLDGRVAGVVRPHVPTLVELLDDPDGRVAGIALSALESVAGTFPEAVAPAVGEAGWYLDDRWIPDDGGGMRLVYSREDHGTGPGEPGEERLTNGVVRPYRSALSLVESVARFDSHEVAPVLDRLRALVRDPVDGCNVAQVVGVLTHVARSNPGEVEPVRDSLERIATGDGPGRIRARNLLRELGADPERADPIDCPDLVTRTDPPSEDARAAVMDEPIDEKAIRGDVDLDLVLSALRSTDSEVRDHAAWGLECGYGAIYGAVHERAASFLALANEPDDCARAHLRRLLGPTAGEYPEAWTPPAAELAGHADPRARAMGLSILASVGGSSPSLTVEHLDAIRAGLTDDHDDVRERAAYALRALADAYTDAVAGSVPELVALVDDRPLPAMRCLASLAEADPAAVAPVADRVVSLVAGLAGPDAIDERPDWHLRGEDEVADERDQSLEPALAVCLALARRDPDAVAAVRPHAERVADGYYWGRTVAINVLAELDARSVS